VRKGHELWLGNFKMAKSLLPEGKCSVEVMVPPPLEVFKTWLEKLKNDLSSTGYSPTACEIELDARTGPF